MSSACFAKYIARSSADMAANISCSFSCPCFSFESLSAFIAAKKVVAVSRFKGATESPIESSSSAILRSIEVGSAGGVAGGVFSRGLDCSVSVLVVLTVGSMVGFVVGFVVGIFQLLGQCPKNRSIVLVSESYCRECVSPVAWVARGQDGRVVDVDGWCWERYVGAQDTGAISFVVDW